MKTNMRKTALRAAIVSSTLAAVLVPWVANAQGFRMGNEDAPVVESLKTRAEKQAPEYAKRLANVWCSACHGPGGKGGSGMNPIFPILAGQSTEYLETQLKSFRALTQDEITVNHETYVERWITNITGLRKDDRYPDATRYEPRAWDFMKGVARDLDDPTIKALAAFFSAVPATPGRPASGDLAKGKTLFEQGDTAKGLLPCASCHGADAHGNGPIPRLAGQHKDYVIDQVKFIKSGTRQVEQMAPLIQNMTDEDIDSVAAYVQSLN